MGDDWWFVMVMGTCKDHTCDKEEEKHHLGVMTSVTCEKREVRCKTGYDPSSHLTEV